MTNGTNPQRARLIESFTAVFPQLDEAQIPHASAASIEGWDSLATVTLMAVVEEAFGVNVAPDDLEHFQSFEAVLRFLERQAPVA